MSTVLNKEKYMVVVHNESQLKSPIIKEYLDKLLGEGNYYYITKEERKSKD